ncbi:cation/H(+) antiporter, partial [bacterium]
MADAHVLEVGIGLTLVGLAGLLASRLKFSIVPLLIIAGMIVGPHAPKIGPIDFRFLESAPLIAFMGRMGILFLL